MNLLQKLTMTPLKGVDPGRYSLCVLGPMSLAVSLGVQVTATALLMLGPIRSDAITKQLTEYGRGMARPENDLLIFLLGCCLTVALVLIMVWYWRAKLATLKVPHLTEAMTASGLLQGVLAAISFVAWSLLASACWFSHDFRLAENGMRPFPETSDGQSMLMPAMLSLFCAGFDLEHGWLGAASPVESFERWKRRASRILAFAMPVIVVLFVGVRPGWWSRLAEQFFTLDAHHHLNFYMMSPALLFTHGKAFGTEIYSQYGVGWPLLSCVLSHFSLLSYGMLIGMEIVYVCIYYTGLFFVLRICFRDDVWAAVALGFALCWQMFSGMNPNEIIWEYPSSTAMRHPMDVWFFGAVILHQRTGKTAWAALAGLAAGLGVIFETETGFYLLVTFLIYTVFQAGIAPTLRRPRGLKSWAAAEIAFFATALGIVLIVLLYASRGTVFTHAFFAGWMEAFVVFAGQGVGALPLAELPDSTFLLFIFMIATYLAVIAYAVIRWWHGSLDEQTVLMSLVACYGMALLLLFVNRSHPFNISHASLPLAVILSGLMARGYQALVQIRARSVLPWVMVCGVLALIVLKPEFQRYPNLLRSGFIQIPTADPMMENFPPTFLKAGAAIRALVPKGEDVAILDLTDPVLYYLSDARPWSRYGSVFFMLVTNQSVEDLRRELEEKPPRFVVMRGKDYMRPPEWEFAWAPLYETVSHHYHLRETSAPYEIWELPNPGGTSK